MKIFKVLKYSSYLAPKPAAQLALKLFLTPDRHKTPEAEGPWIATADQFKIEGIHLYRWRKVDSQTSSGKVLLVHGWSGRGTQMYSFIQPLLDNNYEVIAMDGPAHGNSLGEQTNAGEFSRALLKVGNELGEFKAIIGHSFGAGCIALAATQGLISEKLILISCPADYGRVVEMFLNFVKLSTRSRNHFIQKLVDLAKVDPKDFNIGKLGSQLINQENSSPSKKTLIIHDKHDKEVGFHNAEEISSHWKTAELFSTEGLGHRRILKAPQVVEKATAFVLG